MASFDENGKYIKTNWKAGDKITATKLNKIEESIEAVNDNDISRHVEADARLDALEAKDIAHDKEFTNVKNLIADNKAAAELGDYEINSRMQFLEQELNEGIEEVHNVASTVDSKIAQGKADMAAMVAEVEADLEGLHAKDEEFSEQLAHIENHTSGYVNIKEYEHLVDVDDWTLAIETAFNNSVERGGMKIYFPVGEYKITRPITINFSSSTLEPSFTIEGDGGLGSGIIGNHKSLIKAYNIPNKRAAFEFLGVNNGKVTSMTINNIGIKLDYESCEELSFCLFIGDGFAYTLKKCKLEGFNSVLIRCGSSPNATSYAAMCCKFEQCSFITERYVDWDGVTLREKSKYGYAIAHEWMFTENDYTKFMCDNITYDTCFFGGTVFSFTTSTVFQNCMWYIPGGYKPLITKGTDDNFNSNFFNGDIDCSIGLYIGGGFPTIINPYFEDVPKCIFMKGIAGHSVSSAKIINPSFLGTLNTIPVVNGVEKGCQYAIKAENCGVNSLLSVEGGSISTGNTGFSEGYIINNGVENLDVRGLSGTTMDNIIDNKSRQRTIVYKNSISSNNLLLEFEGKSDGSGQRFVLKDTDIDKFTMDNNYIISKIEIITDNICQGGHTLLIRKNDNISLKIKYGTIYEGAKTILEKGTVTEKYTTNNIPYKDFENSIWNRGFDFKNDSVLSISSSVDSWPSPDETAKIKVKIYLKC